MILVFLGPPGSGKGTQAQKIKQVRSWPQLSTGDLFRENIAGKTKLGLQVEDVLRRGDLVSDDLVVALVKDRTQKPDCREGYILDGFPRTIAQAEALEQMLAERGQGIGSVVLFEVSDSEIEARMSSRRTCRKCGNVISFQYGKECSNCGSTDLLHRDDDLPETVRKRLKVYQNQTKPLVDYYLKKGLLRRINAAQAPEKVFQELEPLTREAGS